MFLVENEASFPEKKCFPAQKKGLTFRTNPMREHILLFNHLVTIIFHFYHHADQGTPELLYNNK